AAQLPMKAPVGRVQHVGAIEGDEQDTGIMPLKKQMLILVVVHGDRKLTTKASSHPSGGKPSRINDEAQAVDALGSIGAVPGSRVSPKGLPARRPGRMGISQ